MINHNNLTNPFQLPRLNIAMLSPYRAHGQRRQRFACLSFEKLRQWSYLVGMSVGSLVIGFGEGFKDGLAVGRAVGLGLDVALGPWLGIPEGR